MRAPGETHSLQLAKQVTQPVKTLKSLQSECSLKTSMGEFYQTVQLAMPHRFRFVHCSDNIKFKSIYLNLEHLFWVDLKPDYPGEFMDRFTLVQIASHFSSFN